MLVRIGSRSSSSVIQYLSRFMMNNSHTMVKTIIVKANNIEALFTDYGLLSANQDVQLKLLRLAS